MAGENSMALSRGKRVYSLLLMTEMLKICNSYLKVFILRMFEGFVVTHDDKIGD